MVLFSQEFQMDKQATFCWYGPNRVQLSLGSFSTLSNRGFRSYFSLVLHELFSYQEEVNLGNFLGNNNLFESRITELERLYPLTVCTLRS